jgi:hypothetical protein
MKHLSTCRPSPARRARSTSIAARPTESSTAITAATPAGTVSSSSTTSCAGRKKKKPKAGSPEALQAEERAYEDHIDQVESARKALKADDDDDEWTTIDGGHSW